jgi:MYXO-CTERM domain-containing protein
MIGAAGVLLAHLVAAQCSGAACPNPCRSCAFQPVEGDNPTLDEWRDTFEQVARRQSDFGIAGGVDSIEVGAARARQDAEFPCRLMPAIGMAESSLSQFCDNGLTVISFDCGFGVMQVTSGAASYPGIEASAGKNVAAGADILAAKWNGDGSFGGTFGDSDPVFLESWYFATWAYNGFVYSNNPENPDHPANRPPFNSPASLSRGSYPYQEIVWGYLAFPQEQAGEPVFDAVDVSYPEGIPNQSGLFSVHLPLPDPAHADSCVEVCPPSGCPPEALRTLILDDEDAGFSVTGDVDSHDEGGFDDHFFSAAPARPATVTATWTGTAPSSGTFEIAGFVPLDPASNEAVPVVVRARGADQRFSLDQGVSGGIFAPLGQVVLLQGERVTVVVDNDSSDAAAGHRLGLDAFRLRWVGDGDVGPGDACDDDVDCAGDALCVDDACAAGCEVAGCDDGAVCDAARGACVGEEGDAGEGEGEGEGDVVGEGEGELPRSLRPGSCGCASTSTTSSAAALLLLLRVLRRRRRQPGAQRL